MKVIKTLDGQHGLMIDEQTGGINHCTFDGSPVSVSELAVKFALEVEEQRELIQQQEAQFARANVQMVNMLEAIEIIKSQLEKAEFENKALRKESDMLWQKDANRTNAMSRLVEAHKAEIAELKKRINSCSSCCSHCGTNPDNHSACPYGHSDCVFFGSKT